MRVCACFLLVRLPCWAMPAASLCNSQILRRSECLGARHIPASGGLDECGSVMPYGVGHGAVVCKVALLAAWSICSVDPWLSECSLGGTQSSRRQLQRVYGSDREVLCRHVCPDIGV
jgi:hypothetical protein